MEQGLQLRPACAGEPELPGVAAVFGGPHPEEPSVLLQLLVGQGAVGVDRVHHLLGQLAQLLRAELGGELREQLFPGVDLVGVEPAPGDRRQRPDHHIGVLRDTSPLRCASARCGRSGSNGSPVMLIRSASVSAARTRLAASPPEIRSVEVSTRVIVP